MAAPRIKVCGMTTVEDALAVAEAGADALGFVFYANSPRCVAPERVADIVAKLPPFVTTVGLFVNASRETIARTMTVARLDIVQLHGDERPGECLVPPWRVIKALRVKNADSLQGATDFPVAALLLDAWSDEAYGGTGHQFDWQLARSLGGARPLILAGGLHPGNVARAVAAVRPYGVDVSSGVEISPGRKDIAKVKEFIKQVRNA